MNKNVRTILIVGSLGVVAYLLYKGKIIGKKSSEITPKPTDNCPKCGAIKCDKGTHPEQVGDCGCKCVDDSIIKGEGVEVIDSHPAPPQGCNYDDNFNLICDENFGDSGEISVGDEEPLGGGGILQSGDDVVLFPKDEVIETPNYDGFVLHASSYGFVTKGVLRLFLTTNDFQSFFKESLGKDFTKVINVTDDFFNSFPKGENMPSTSVVTMPTDDEPLGSGGILATEDSGIGEVFVSDTPTVFTTE